MNHASNQIRCASSMRWSSNEELDLVRRRPLELARQDVDVRLVELRRDPGDRLGELDGLDAAPLERRGGGDAGRDLALVVGVLLEPLVVREDEHAEEWVVRPAPRDHRVLHEHATDQQVRDVLRIDQAAVVPLQELLLAADQM